MIKSQCLSELAKERRKEIEDEKRSKLIGERTRW
jgi:hypothetical protein